MQVTRYEYGKSPRLGKAVIALGLFDGIHLGHRTLLNKAREIARARGLLFGVFTFVGIEGVKGGSPLFSDKNKLRLLEELGADTVYLADFGELSDVTADGFISTSLISEMECEVAVAGFDFTFGKGKSGNARLLEQTLKSLGKECLIIDEVKANGEKISTTRIKSLLAEGRVKEAAELLGKPYFISSTVIKGDGRGRGLGFPTVNTELSDTHLKRGVYEARVTVFGTEYPAITNVGTCPTFGERELHAETFILGYEGDLYGESVDISLTDFIRDERVFSSEEDLKLQINKDIDKILKG